jgi:hypothetical protein
MEVGHRMHSGKKFHLLSFEAPLGKTSRFSSKGIATRIRPVVLRRSSSRRSRLTPSTWVGALNARIPRYAHIGHPLNSLVRTRCRKSTGPMAFSYSRFIPVHELLKEILCLKNAGSLATLSYATSMASSGERRSAIRDPSIKTHRRKRRGRVHRPLLSHVQRVGWRQNQIISWSGANWLKSFL